jgi:sugar phosphate isomerase/epimerase
MAASREDVDRWIRTAKKMGAKHIISVCDTFDWDDYPVYVMPDENLEERKKDYNGVDMQRINEIITINEDGTVTEGR